MIFSMIPKAYNAFLLLEDGKFCQGWSFFSSLMSIGEIVFNTGMTGYQEIITDPSYCDQIILFTYPEIGNTGINFFDMESDRPYVKGLIAKNICLSASNWRSKMSLIDYLIKNRIPHIFGIDTRSLTRYLREKGVMIAVIANSKLTSSYFDVQLQNFKSSQDCSIIDKVTVKQSYIWSPKLLTNIIYKFKNHGPSLLNSLKVVVIDYGVKFNILNMLMYYGCHIIIMPASTSYESIIAEKPDGILLSNGPGDPSLIYYAIENIQNLINANIPIFGICLGHQLLSLALGAQTNKLKFGHRGLNHPSGEHNIVGMTSQNHGYVVSVNNIPSDIVDVVSLNLNDNTISGIVHKYKPCFSVQYHPEASPGPHDYDYLFAYFIKFMLLCK